MKLEEGDLTAEVEGRIVKDGKVLVVRAIEVTYRLRAAADPQLVERVRAFHADFCPVARTLAGCVEITTRIAEPPG